MIGSFLTRGLVMIFGYAYPAYECYKAVEKNKPDIEQLRFWCQYWILIAVLTVCERLGDAFISWVPLYSEAKLAFFIYLWYPKTKGTAYVYDSFFRPYVAKHETEIDRNLLELRTRAGDIAILYCQRAASYGQTRIFEILQYIALQSTPAPPSAQTAQKGAKACQPTAAPSRQTSIGPNRQSATALSRQTSNGPNRKSAAAPSRQSSTASQSETEEPPSPTSSTSSSQQQNEVAEEVAPPKRPKANSTVPTSRAPKANISSDATGKSTQNEAEAMQIEVMPPSTKENTDHPSPKETVKEEAIRVTRGRLRRTRTTGQR